MTPMRSPAAIPFLLLLVTVGPTGCGAPRPPQAPAPRTVAISEPTASKSELPESPPAREPAPMDEPAPEAVPAEPDHREEVEAIADLLIEDQPVAAKQAAERLLNQARLSPADEVRARQLLAMATARIEVPATPVPPPPPPALPPFPDASYEVVEAAVDSWFAAGRAGSSALRRARRLLRRRGRSTSPMERPRNGSTHSASTTASGTPVTPLSCASARPRLTTLALTDSQGGFPAPDGLLAAFARARRAAHARAVTQDDTGAANAPGKDPST